MAHKNLVRGTFARLLALLDASMAISTHPPEELAKAHSAILEPLGATITPRQGAPLPL